VNSTPEILFYCLERRSLEDILPGLLERTAERGWRAIVRVDSQERMNALDLHLWSYSEKSFLAHGTPQSGHSSRQPVYLTTGDENPNGATVLFLSGGEIPSQWAAGKFATFARVVVIFDGQNPELSRAAQTSWQSAEQAGHAAVFWRQSASGKWEQQKSVVGPQFPR
jgi:DNA polymerase III subunit chi